MANIRRRGDRWSVQIRRAQNTPIYGTFKTRREAEQWARDQETKIDAGAILSPTKRLTIAELVQSYRDLREAGRPILDTANEHYMLRRIVEGLGNVKAHALSVAHLIDYCKDRSRQGANPYTRLMEISKIGTVYRHAGVGLRLPDTVKEAYPPLRHAGLIGGGGRRERRPTEDELSRLLAELPERFRPVVRLMVAIGLRRGEVCKLRWEDLDRERKLILVRDRKDPREKAGNDQWVPLIRGAWEIVSAAPVQGSAIFPHHPQTLSKAFKATCDALGIPDLHLHDLRHEAISQMFEQGMTIEQVALVSGHKDWKHLKRYTNLRPESLHDLTS